MPPASAVGAAPSGRVAENIVHFVRVLRAAGLPVGTAHTLAAQEAAVAVGIAEREDFRAALAAVLVSRYEHLPVFEQAFDLFWQDPRLLQRVLASFAPAGEVAGERDPEQEIAARIAQAMLPAPSLPERKAAGGTDHEPAFTFSPREVLQHRDFETMTADELAAVKTMLGELRLPLPELPTRRTVAAARGQRVDLRATLRRATGAAGALSPLRWRRRGRRTPPLVILCDISGSMDRYARMLLHFLHAITGDRDRIHVLLFGTRLTNITRHLRHRDVDVALARVRSAVPDWAGGTRIGACLDEFNRRWSRRLLGQNAVVLLISDGLDAEAGDGLGVQMERLHKSCRRLVWLNPLLRYEGFEPRPAGIRAMLPHVDEFLPVHNLDSLVQLARALEAPGRAQRDGAAPGAGARRARERAGGVMDSVDLEVLKRSADWLDAGRRALLVTVVKTWGSSPRPPGAMLAVRDDGLVAGSVSGGCVEDDIVGRIRADGITATKCDVVTYGVSADEARRFGLPCGGTIQLVVEPLTRESGIRALVGEIEARRLVARRLDIATGAATLAPGQRDRRARVRRRRC